MAVDLNRTVKAEFWSCWISVKNMKKALEKLKDDDELFPNQVGSLAVCRDKEYIAYIDIVNEVLEVNEEEED